MFGEKRLAGWALVIGMACFTASGYDSRSYTGSGNWNVSASWTGGIQPTRGERANMTANNTTVTVTDSGEVAGAMYIQQSGVNTYRTNTLRIVSGSLLVDYDGSSDMPSYMWDTVYLGINTSTADGNLSIIDHQGGSFSTGILSLGTGGEFIYRGHYYVSEVDPATPTLFSVGKLEMRGSSVFKVTGSGIDTLAIGGSGLDIKNGVDERIVFVAGSGGVRRINVSGPVVLKGNLDVDLSALTALPESIVLIEKSGSAAISGTFSRNAPEGKEYKAGSGRYYGLTYSFDAGGDGNKNDVALVLLPPRGTMLSVK